MASAQDRPIGLGCMRLSTSGDRQDTRSVDTLVAAIDAGVTLLDTADSYGLDEGDVGHNERLIAEARALRPDAAITVVTKGGLTRPGGRWQPDGRAVALAAAARASRARLGGAPIDLYVLHAVDPKVPLATSVRALARLRDDGEVRAIGVGNVNRAMLEEALAIAPIAAVEVELSPWNLTALRGGVVALCEERGLRVIAHRPLGGVAGAKKLARDRVVGEVAARLGVTPAELAIAWLRGLSPVIVPIPGATTVEHARSAARAAGVALDDDARAVLGRRFEVDAGEPAAPTVDGEVVVLMGIPGAGKSTHVASFVERGYARLNRDERGGTLAQLARALDDALASGTRRVVLDNTYPSRALRAPVIAAARRHGVASRCVVLDTSIEDAQVNAVTRMLDRHGRLLSPEEMKRAAKDDPGMFVPGVQFRWRREHEPPAVDEGFAAVDVVPFVRTPGAGGARAVIVELGRDPLSSSARDVLRAWHDADWRVLATAWAPDGEPAPTLTLDGGVAVDVVVCPHGAGPPVCWCRKPLPGLGLVLARKHGLDLRASVHVGRGAADRGFAARLGMRYVEVEGETWPAAFTA